MNTFVNYLIELNLGLIFFYGAYWLLFRNETQFTTNRWFLVLSMLGSVLFPLFTISGTQSGVIPTLSNTIPTHWLPEIVIVGNGTVATPETPTNYWGWITPIYISVAAFLILLFLIRVIKIIWLFYKAKRYTWKTYTIAESDHVQGTFSFFSYIFINAHEQLDAVEKEEILTHETVHVQKGHSFDVMLIHLLQVVCWFNPIIRFYKTSLVQVHEFEADARSVEGMDVDRYCGLLAKVTLQQNGFALANHFTNSFTLKRINMMKTVRRKISQWKLASAILMLATYFVVVACQDQLSDVKAVADNSTIALTYPEEVRIELEKARQGMPGTEFYVLEMNEEGKRKMDEITKELQLASLEGRPVIVKQGNEIRNFFIYKKDGQTSRINSITASENGVHSIVDESAQPNGGMPEFYKHIAASLKYPAAARQKGVEGRVFIEFIVNEDGSISNAHPIKGIGGGCDEEAARAVASSPAWIPAKQDGKIVKQKMVVPIIFALGNSESKIDKGQSIPNAMDEMVVVGDPKKN